MSKPNSQYYSNSKFDRASVLRKQDHPVPDTDLENRLIFIYNQRFFFKKSDSVIYSTLLTEARLDDSVFFLGQTSDCNYYGRDITHEDTEWINSDDLELKDLREMVFSIDHESSALLAYFKGLSHWHQTYQFCGQCGSKTHLVDSGHARRCAVCNKSHFPRIDPAIIVLIEHHPTKGEPKCLLNIRRSEDQTMCTAFAGFVEIGESLEDAVIREVKEEVDVDIINPRYLSSQPWSFPSSIMVGFRAQASSEYFKVDGDEIKEARWFTARELKNLADTNQIILSRQDSIARYLIEGWLADNL